MSKSIQLKNINNEKMYPNPYYPVGSIYLSVNNINPSKWFGGKWEQIAKGRTLVGVDTSQTEFNNVKKTGGEKTHKLIINEIPRHRHSFRVVKDNATNSGGELPKANNSQGDNVGWGRQIEVNNMDNALGYTGGDQPHNNLQPYFTCYIWCRIA